jgi:periplasmic protein TonB
MARSVIARDLSEGKHYTWSFPGSANVQLNLDFVSRLQARLADVEQGLLLGIVNRGCTEVVDFQPLSTEEAARLRASGPPPPSETAPSPVGYLRVERNGDLRLNDEDLELAKTAFPNPHEVVLLIRYGGASPAKATFFFWDGGRMFGDFAVLEFPFDASSLAAMERRKETALQPAKKETSLAPSPLPERSAPKRRAPSRAPWVILLGAVVLLGGILIAPLVMQRDRPDAFPGRPPAASATSAVLGLRVERQERDLLITWNGNAPAIAQASAGALTIEDGDVPRVIPLDRNFMRGGKLLYTPDGDQVRMRLTVERPGQQPISEIFLVIASAGQAKFPKPQVSNAPSPVTTTAVPRQPSPRAAGEKGLGAAERQPANSAPPTETKAAPLTASPQPGSPPPTGATPPVIPAESERPTGAEAKPLTATASPQPADLPSTAPEPTTNPVAPFRPGVSRRSAEILSRTSVAVPPMFRGPLFKPETLTLTIALDEKGRIAKITVSPRRLEFLVQAAETAVRKWKFRPAQAGDQDVPGEIVVHITFTPLP